MSPRPSVRRSFSSLYRVRRQMVQAIVFNRGIPFRGLDLSEKISYNILNDGDRQSAVHGRSGAGYQLDSKLSTRTQLERSNSRDRRVVHQTKAGSREADNRSGIGVRSHLASRVGDGREGL